MTPLPCPACGCPACVPLHAVIAALRDGDLDRALDAGLLQVAACPACAPGCDAVVATARAERLAALAARERFRARQLRLGRRQQERGARRAAVRPAPVAGAQPVPPLPPAAAAALARAKARAARKP